MAAGRPGRGYLNQIFPAITVAETDMRSLPTHAPIFDSAQQGNGGYPFDWLQQTRLAPDTLFLVLAPVLPRDGA